MGKGLDPENVKLGQRLQDYRLAAHVTQQEMADFCKLSKNYISALERGVNKCSVKTLLHYCNLLKVSPSELIGYEVNRVDPELLSLLSKLDKTQQKKVLNMIRAIL